MPSLTCEEIEGSLREENYGVDLAGAPALNFGLRFALPRPAVSISAFARCSHLARISSSSSVRRSSPTKELFALLTRINSSSFTWMAAEFRFCEF